LANITQTKEMKIIKIVTDWQPSEKERAELIKQFHGDGIEKTINRKKYKAVGMQATDKGLRISFEPCE